jgi:hypothetical protein
VALHLVQRGAAVREGLGVRGSSAIARPYSAIAVGAAAELVEHDAQVVVEARVAGLTLQGARQQRHGFGRLAALVQHDREAVERAAKRDRSSGPRDSPGRRARHRPSVGA